MKKNSILLTLAIVFTALFLVWSGVRIVKAVRFDLDCAAYLKRAAAANTVEMARKELANAIDYAESNGLTEGTVSVFLKNPGNDIGFWYQNMKNGYAELGSLPDDATSLEKTNVLMKLRESIIGVDDSGGTKVIFPDGIEIYPNNVLYFWWAMLSGVAAFALWFPYFIVVIRKTQEYNRYQLKKGLNL